jgi:hypothetical protein
MGHEMLQRLQVGDTEHKVSDADLAEAFEFADNLGGIACDKVFDGVALDLGGIF